MEFSLAEELDSLSSNTHDYNFNLTIDVDSLNQLEIDQHLNSLLF